MYWATIAFMENDNSGAHCASKRRAEGAEVNDGNKRNLVLLDGLIRDFGQQLQVCIRPKTLGVKSP